MRVQFAIGASGKRSGPSFKWFELGFELLQAAMVEPSADLAAVLKLAVGVVNAQ